MYINRVQINYSLLFLGLIASFEFIHRVSQYPFLKNADELILLLLPLIFFSKLDRIFALFFVAIVLISVENDFNFTQLLLDAKFFLLSFFALIYTRYENNKYADRFFLFYFYFILVIFLFELMLNQTYESILLGDYIATYYIGDVEYHRFSSIFVHPGELALYCVASIVAFFSSKAKEKTKYIVCTILFLLLILTFQRFEILTFLSLLVVFYAFGRSWYVGSLIILSLTSFILYGSFIYFSFFEQMYLDQDYDPRTAMYIASFDIFSENYINGIGAGNFASHMSVGNYQYYDYTGISNLWWFDGARYLTDTFWPKIFSEYGSLGFFLYAFAFYYLIKISKKNKWLVFIILYLFLLSLQSPIIFNTYLVLYSFIVVSYSMKKN